MVVEEPSQIDGEKSLSLVVLNSKNQSVSITPIKPVNNSTLGLESKKSLLRAGNFRKSLILERDEENGSIRRVHTLAPV